MKKCEMKQMEVTGKSERCNEVSKRAKNGKRKKKSTAFLHKKENNSH